MMVVDAGGEVTLLLSPPLSSPLPLPLVVRLVPRVPVVLVVLEVDGADAAAAPAASFCAALLRRWRPPPVPPPLLSPSPFQTQHECGKGAKRRANQERQEYRENGRYQKHNGHRASSFGVWQALHGLQGERLGARKISKSGRSIRTKFRRTVMVGIGNSGFFSRDPSD